MTKTAPVVLWEKTGWVLLFIVLIFIGLIRYGMLDVPLERDEGEYAYAGQLLLQGKAPYADIYNMKFPGVYFAYALILSVFGQTHQGIHLALLLVTIVSTVFLFLIAKQLMSPICAAAVALCFAVLSASPAVQGMFANAEYFVVMFVLGSIFFLMQALENDKTGLLFLSGVLAGTGIMMKQHGLLFMLFGVSYIAVSAAAHASGGRKKVLIRILLYFVGVMAALACLLFCLFYMGVLEKFWFWTIWYSAAYINQVPLQYGLSLFVDRFGAIISMAPLLWAVTGAGLVILLFMRSRPRLKIFLSLFFFFSLASLCPGLYFRPHYFILLLPCASLLSGLAVYRVIDFLQNYGARYFYAGIFWLIFLAGVSQAVWKHSDVWFQMTPSQISRAFYRLNPFPESIEIADFIHRHSDEDDAVAILGSEPQILFYARRKSASGYIYMYPLMEHHDFAGKMRKDFIRDIEASDPKFIVWVNIPYSWLGSADAQIEILRWFSRYRQKRSLKPVGLVELFPDKTRFAWGTDCKWPAASRYWIGIFEAAAPNSL